MKKNIVPIPALDVPPRTTPSLYPEPFASLMEGREKRQLGDFFNLTNFGVNLTRLKPQAVSALRHAHSKQDEFMYILQGRPTLQTDDGCIQLSPGMCVGFPAGKGNANNLINQTAEDVLYLEVGDRTPGDEVVYPDDDIQAVLVDGKWAFTHKDASPYDE
ncbi:MAG: cupin domain-containing protein [Candidatus Thiodiazotropha sp.]|jgi:uncharacterized cupin superfamily protein